MHRVGLDVLPKYHLSCLSDYHDEYLLVMFIQPWCDLILNNLNIKINSHGTYTFIKNSELIVLSVIVHKPWLRVPSQLRKYKKPNFRNTLNDKIRSSIEVKNAEHSLEYFVRNIQQDTICDKNMDNLQPNTLGSVNILGNANKNKLFSVYTKRLVRVCLWIWSGL